VPLLKRGCVSVYGLAFANFFEIPLSNQSVAAVVVPCEPASVVVCVGLQRFPNLGNLWKPAKTRELGNMDKGHLCPISRKPPKFTCANSGNLRKPKTPGVKRN